MLVLLAAVVTGAWAADELYLVVDGTSATLKYDSKKGENDPYYSSGGFAGWTNAGSVKTTATTITVDATCKNFEGTSLSALFFNFTALTSINNLENLNMANVTNISGMFRQCSSLTAIDVSSFNTAQVTNMNFLFMGCTSLTTLDLSNFNTASVESMIQMFDGCSSLENIYVGDGWNTDAVTESNNMFRSCSKLPNYASSKVDKTNAHTDEGGYLKLKPKTYKVTLQEGTEDATNWTVPEEAAEGASVTATYSGEKKVKSVKAVKKGGAVDNTYLKWDADQKKLVATDIPAEVTMVANADADVNWEAGTYVVEGDVTIGGTIALLGNVDLIIKDGAKLTVNSYILGSDKNLSIYGQANQSGQLVVNSSGDAIVSITTLEVHSCKVKATTSGDACGGFYIDEINVYGGSVDAEYTGTQGDGIKLTNNGSMNIYGGEVKAVGKGTKCGITCVSESSVTVYGGKLWAENADNAAIDSDEITLTKGAGFSGKIETSDNGSSWTQYNDDATPGTKYVRVGY